MAEGADHERQSAGLFAPGFMQPEPRPPRHTGLVKQDYNLVYKGVQPPEGKGAVLPIYEAVLSEETPEYGKYTKLIEKKRREYRIENQKIREDVGRCCTCQMAGFICALGFRRTQTHLLERQTKAGYQQDIAETRFAAPMGARERKNPCWYRNGAIPDAAIRMQHLGGILRDLHP